MFQYNIQYVLIYVAHCLRNVVIHSAESRGIKRSSMTCALCVPVCVPVHTIEPKRLKLQSSNLPHVTYLILGQKVKGQGHKVTKCKDILKAIE